MTTAEIRLRPGQTAVVGYGSLLSPDSLSRSLGGPYDGPFVACRVNGWRRSWDAFMPNQAYYFEKDGQRTYPRRILYLNASPDPASAMNAVVFVVGAKALAALHEREWIYHSPAVNERLLGVRVSNGAALLYVANPDYRAAPGSDPAEAAVRKSYLAMVDRVVAGLDPDGQRLYRQTTDPVPEHLVVDDSLDPARPNPWAAVGARYLPG